MATLILTAVGSMFGPIGGALGALVGRQLDGRIFGGGSQKGPRLKELSVTTSSYGTPMARHFGRMRVAGSIIWATDLVEHKEKSGGGKGSPKVTTYSYSASFAVALSSRRINDVGRIWADGNLLRGSAGDLKASGEFRLYTGEHDQQPDPLIAAKEGEERCPAFRGIAYAVFEDLDLSDFGNRIPALTFEVIADDGAISLARMTDGVIPDCEANLPLPGLAGFSCEGALIEDLSALDPIFPMDCDACGDRLTLAPERLQGAPILLTEASVSVADDEFGGREGRVRRRKSEVTDPTRIIRYYDIDRDYQPGLQRAAGQPGPGQPKTVDLPAAMTAGDARQLAEKVARRTRSARETMSWRTSELNPAVAPGVVVVLPGEPGRWRVDEWEWRASGVELTLVRIPPGDMATSLASDPGRSNPPIDLATTPSQIAAFEIPWDGIGTGDSAAIFAAVSSASAGWSGAALFVDHGDGQLVSLGTSGRGRSIIGTCEAALPNASPHVQDRMSAIVVQLVDPDMILTNATLRQLAQGANRALVGSEIVQFARATPLGSGRWQLDTFLRGRGGTEGAIGAHGASERFVLLDSTPVLLDPAIVGTIPGTEIVALGRGDSVAVSSAIACQGIGLRPLAPVHPAALLLPDGTLELRWTRRARGAWTWNDGVDVPLHEQSEAYRVTYGPIEAPIATWDVTAPALTLAPSTIADLHASLAAGPIQVRQLGSYALSPPLHLIDI